MGIFLFLLSFPAAIAAWVFIAKKLKASGKNAAVRHFAGVAAGFFVWVFVIMIGIKADEGKTEEAQTAQAASEPARVATPAAASSAQPQAMAEKAAEPPEEQVVEKVATLDLDWETFRRRVNEDFASVDFGAKIPASIKPEGSKNSVRDVAMLPFNDHLFSNIAVDPQSKQLTSISVTVGPSENSVENIKNFSAAALLLSAAAGDDGNKKVGGQIIKMINASLEQFGKSSKKTDAGDVKNNFVEDGVKYGILISKVLPRVMLYAEPEKSEKQ